MFDLCLGGRLEDCTRVLFQHREVDRWLGSFQCVRSCNGSQIYLLSSKQMHWRKFSASMSSHVRSNAPSLRSNWRLSVMEFQRDAVGQRM